MKRLLVVFALVLVAGALLASTALAAPTLPGHSFNMGSWMRSRTGNVQGAPSTPAPGSVTPAPRSPAAGTGMGGMMGGIVGGGTMMNDLQKLLGFNFQEIHAQMVAGKSLVEMAAAKGVTKDQLVTALLDGRKAALDQAVKDGRITQEQATTMLQYMEKNIETMVTAQGMSGMMQGMGGMMGGMMGGATPAPGGASTSSCPMHSGQPSPSSGQTGGAAEPQGELQQA